MTTINPIVKFHELTKKRPQDFSRKIHKMVDFTEQIISRKDVEYRPADPEHFEEFCKNHIKHIEGVWAGKPFILSREQKWIIHCVLGIKIRHKVHKNWVRYFKEVFIFVGKKWGKTMLMSALIIWFTLFDGENAAACYILSGNATQAARLYDSAEIFIEKDDVLKECLKKRTVEGKRRMYVKGTASFFSYESGTPKNKDGFNPHVGIFDEIHEIVKTELYSHVRTAQGARDNPLIISISTAGIIRNSLYDEKLNVIEKLCKQKKPNDNSPVFFAVFEIDPEDNPDDEKCWIKANPGLPDNRPSIWYLRKECANSRLSAIDRPSFIAKNLNRPSNNALTYIELDELKNARIGIKHELYYDTYAFGGLDLSDTTDLTCAVALIPINPECTRFIFLQKYFVAENRIERLSETDNKHYLYFKNTESPDPVARELLYVCNGMSVDKEDVANWFLELEEKYKIVFLKIGYDPYYGKKEFLKYAIRYFQTEKVQKDENGIEIRDEGVLTEVRQGAITMSEPIKHVKAAFTDGNILYDKTNALFEFCVHNLKVHVDINKNLTFDKAKSTGRIDGFAALVDAWVAMERGREVYLGIDKIHNKYQSGEKEFESDFISH